VAAIEPIAAPLADPRGFVRVRRVVDELAPQLRPWRIAATLFSLFGLLGLTAAAAGVYGLVGFDVTQRTREIGIRIAMGATTRSIIRLILTSGLRVILIGLAVGIGAVVLSGRVIASLLYDTSPYDPIALVVTAATLVVVALLASLIPAWRATRVDPVTALRAD